MNLSSLKLLLAIPAADQAGQNAAPTTQTAATTQNAAQTVQSPTAQMLNFILLMGVMVLVFWLLMIRPQQKRNKELAAMISSLRPGDKITTSSGIVGVVVSIKDNTICLRSNDTKLDILKTAVAEVKERGGENA